tara:strand:+ start:68 stop:250 length:183 start_codon:yes stop_codon:yes gene_type:complete
MAQRFFKKANGVIFEATSNHDMGSLEDRFMECDANGNEIKKEKPKAKPKKKEKKAKKEDK